MHLTSKQILLEDAEIYVRNAFEIGKGQYIQFNKSRVSLYDTIKKNRLALFRQKNTVSLKSKQKTVTLQERCNLFKDFYISCQTQQGNLEQFFSHVNHDFPPSLSEYGKLRRPPSKSDILDYLKSASVTQFERYDTPPPPPPAVDTCVIDEPAWVRMHPPKSSKTFGMYCCDEVLSPIVRSDIKRSDFIFDIYLSDSLKKGERIRRGCNDNRFSVRRNFYPEEFHSVFR